MQTRLAILSLLLVIAFCSHALGQGQRGSLTSNTRHIIYGDIKVDQGQAGTDKPISLDLILYNEYGNQISRQRVQSNGRYRFIDLPDGRYYICLLYTSDAADERSS